MRKVQITREISGDQGTFGTWLSDSGFTCRTGELPWRENEPDRSCIPAGRYTCTWRESSKHGMCYHIEGVPNRTGVEIHAANFMGDKSKGYQCELLGCIAPGLGMGTLAGQLAMTSSKIALLRLEDDLQEEAFELTILDPAWP